VEVEGVGKVVGVIVVLESVAVFVSVVEVVEVGSSILGAGMLELGSTMEILELSRWPVSLTPYVEALSNDIGSDEFTIMLTAEISEACDEMRVKEGVDLASDDSRSDAAVPLDESAPPFKLSVPSDLLLLLLTRLVLSAALTNPIDDVVVSRLAVPANRPVTDEIDATALVRVGPGTVSR